MLEENPDIVLSESVTDENENYIVSGLQQMVLRLQILVSNDLLARLSREWVGSINKGLII